MKWRKKVIREVVDAIKGDDGFYYIANADGSIRKTPHPDFELNYEPVRRERTAKPRKARKEKAAT